METDAESVIVYLESLLKGLKSGRFTVVDSVIDIDYHYANSLVYWNYDQMEIMKSPQCYGYSMRMHLELSRHEREKTDGYNGKNGSKHAI